jgi:hypothetical protein
VIASSLSLLIPPQPIGVHLALFADDTYLYATEHKEGYVLKKTSAWAQLNGRVVQALEH